ncbi:hypothetical protein [Sphingomonas sp.]|uniref:hypothetical protein n=1 Tax=Sphingomonas sp. TaxID=28214 RepID=UPI0035C7FF51
MVRISFQVRRLSASLRKQLNSSDRDKREQAEQVVAATIIDKALSSYEILSNAPVCHPAAICSALQRTGKGPGVHR